MKNLIGLVHSQSDGDYRLVGIKNFGEEFSNMKRAAEENGKYPAYFFFSKILKNGKLSQKQSFVALMFKESKKIVKL